MAIPSITPLPAAPSRLQPAATFNTNANNFLAALPTLAAEENNMIAAINTLSPIIQNNSDNASAKASQAATSATQAANSATTATASAAAAQAAIGLPALKAGRLLRTDGVTVSWDVVDGATQYATTDFSALIGKSYDINTVSSTVNVSTPSNPNPDDWFAITDSGNANANPITVKRAGTNFATFPEAIDNAAWVKARCTVSPNTLLAPDGTLTADSLIEDSSAATDHYLQQGFYTNCIVGSTYTFSVYAKQNTRSSVELWVMGNSFIDGGIRDARFNLSTGVVISAGANVISTAITPVGNGWYRCSMTVQPTISTAPYALIRLHNGTTSNYTGDGVSNINVWGAKLELGASASFYDPVTVSTNLLTYSQQIDNAAWYKGLVTAAAGTFVAPDGTATANKIVETAATSSHYIQIFQTITAGAMLTASVYLKQGERSYAQLSIDDGSSNGGYANFNLALGTVDTASTFRGTGSTLGAAATITNAGNGWWKCTVSSNCGASSTTARLLVFIQATSGASFASSYLGDITKGIYAWGAQLEIGTIATPYIQTLGTSSSRTSGVPTKIMGLVEDMTVSVPYASFKMIYLNEFRGWVLR